MPAETAPPVARPRVGYVVKVYPRFSETFVVREVLAREAQGEDVVVASLRPTTDTRFHALLARVAAPVTWLPESGGRSSTALWSALRRAQELPHLAAALPHLLAEDVDVAAQAVQLAVWAREQRVTHLHAHFASLPGRTTRLAALLTGLPYTVTAHAKDLFVHGAGPDGPDGPVCPRVDAVLADAAAVVTVSDHNVAHLAARHPRARAVRVYNGLDLDELPWSAPAPGRVVAAVGRLVPKKGFDVLLDAVALLRAAGDPVRLDLAGSGPQEAALRERARAAGLDGAVRFLGPQPQHAVVDLLRRSAVFAAPCVVAADGDRDGLPTVLLEAMAVGTPVVSTPVTGIPEAVLDGVTGTLVPERDPAALAAALRRLLDDPELRLERSRAARRLVEERFDARDQAARLRALTEAPAVAA
ncbi:glycosyltransferase [Kineococcus sp. SYSU DK004]|uniref:glycosyltransferase n=1 Tax=Kineococcus sp. SYSU DK004 TaxID=3383125 RepID=UPI003D7EBEBE